MPNLIAGIDAGGTRTKLLARTSDGHPDIAVYGPAANLLRQGHQETAHVLASLVRQALAERPHATLHSVCAGVAGAGDNEEQCKLRAIISHVLREVTPFRLHITHDGIIALEAAFGGDSGLMIVAGTGSVLLARTCSAQTVRSGGWGYIIGDEGSGHALGVRALRAISHTHDGGPATILERLLEDRYGLAGREKINRAVYRDAWPVQHMAMLVLEAAAAGDTIAQDILQQETCALARQAFWLVRRSPPIERRVAVSGGLSNSSLYLESMAAALQDILPGWKLQSPRYTPVEGAVRLAASATGSVVAQSEV